MKKLSLPSIEALRNVITGDNFGDKQISPYLTGKKLISFFKQFGYNDEYSTDFPPRGKYVEDKLLDCNGGEVIEEVIKAITDPRRYIGTNLPLEEAVEYLNVYFKYDGFVLKRNGDRYILVNLEELVPVKIYSPQITDLDFIMEQLRKCEDKIDSKDYDGAITNARALVESVMLNLERLTTGEIKNYDGDLMALYKRLQKSMNLDPEKKEISDRLRDVLRGLTSIVYGLASLRNKMSDSHPRIYKPEKHHSKLIVNSARTLTVFLIESYEHQKSLAAKK